MRPELPGRDFSGLDSVTPVTFAFNFVQFGAELLRSNFEKEMGTVFPRGLGSRVLVLGLARVALLATRFAHQHPTKALQLALGADWG